MAYLLCKGQAEAGSDDDGPQQKHVFRLLFAPAHARMAIRVHFTEAPPGGGGGGGGGVQLLMIALLLLIRETCAQHAWAATAGACAGAPRVEATCHPLKVIVNWNRRSVCGCNVLAAPLAETLLSRGLPADALAKQKQRDSWGTPSCTGRTWRC